MEAIEAAPRLPFSAYGQADRAVRTRFQAGQAERASWPVDATLLAVIEMLAVDALLPSRYVDHPMKGQFADCRDCHLRPDLVLVYRKRGADVLEMIRIGTHAQLAI